MIPKALEIVKERNMLDDNGIVVTKIDTSEEICQGYKDIKLINERKYGNTTVCFYKFVEE
ncbi:hypothetical protein D3C73_1024110 [compost metagenome]